MQFILAITPIFMLILLLGFLKRPAHEAGILSLITAVVIALGQWKTNPMVLTGAVLEGASIALWPIMIVIVAAIFSYNLAEATGSMDKIKNILSHVTEDRRIHVLILAWGFGGFLESVAGYGTAVAIPASIMAALGFNPLFSAVICLIANTVPTAFGAIGIPVTTLASMTGLDASVLSSFVALQLTPFIIIIPFILVMMTGGSIKAVKGVFGITLASGLAFAIPQFFVAKYLGAQLPALLGSLSSMTITILLAQTFYKKKSNSKEKDVFSFQYILQAWMPYLIILTIILLASSLVPPIHSLLGHVKSEILFVKGHSPVTFKWIATPGVLIIIAGYLSGLLEGFSLKRITIILGKTFLQLLKTTITVMSIVALAKIMSYSGMIREIANTLAVVTGPVYPFISPLVGTLGTFVTGSDTSSNILFGGLQKEIAHSLDINAYWLAAANTSGATAGKMISPQSIAVATSATNLVGQEGAIFSKTLLFCLIYVALLGVFVGLLA